MTELEDTTRQERQSRLETAFREHFHQDPQFLSQAPGRVNLIGEHIDYHGYPVLPMALNQSMLMAVSRNDSQQIHLKNLNSERYPDFICGLEDLQIDREKPRWYHYVLCGIRGVIEELCEEDRGKASGMNVVLDGDVPPNAGLSSSSALVCCAALATMQINKMQIPLDALATLCAKAERYIGTEGGGMDQAISFLAQAGKAKLIEFDPLRSTDVCLPEEGVFVVANCCLELNKAATSHFNTRVAEGRVGVQLLSSLRTHDSSINWREMKKAIFLQDYLISSSKEMLTLVTSSLHEEPYLKDEICDILGISEDEFKKVCLSPSTQHLEKFELRKRLTHIFSESQRVLNFQVECASGRKNLQVLGDLMYASHVSCRDEYDCSCGDLDELVEVMMKSGAYGARLTGAGWGGCAVALIKKGTQNQFLENVRKKFFEKNQHRMENVEDALFVTSPGDGAQILPLTTSKQQK